MSEQVVLNNLLKHTSLQSRFSCNMVALVDGRPQMLNLKQFLSLFLEFRSALSPILADMPVMSSFLWVTLFLLDPRDIFS